MAIIFSSRMQFSESIGLMKWRLDLVNNVRVYPGL
jgi:hypothetical protein